MEQKKNKYLGSLDLLRGLAALAVAYFHFTHGNKDFLSHEGLLYKSGTVGFLGKISYSLYLIHIPIGGRVLNLIEVFTENELLRSIGVFVALAISIFSAWLFYLLIEAPAVRWAKMINYKK